MGAGATLNFWGLLILPGVLGRHWAIWYPKEPVCAVRGSTVVIPCTYFYPEGNQVKETMWCLNHENCIQTLYVCHSKNVSVSSGYKDRAECLGDKEKYCTLMIKNIRHTDTGVYKFRFITDKDKWYGKEGVTVLITELRVVMTSSSGNGSVKEGDFVNLTCTTDSCSLNQSEFIWFKDKEHLPETHFILHFHSVSLKHFGKYSCAIKGYEETVSTDYHLDVQNVLTVSHVAVSVELLVLLVVIPLILFVMTLVIIICIKRKKTGSLRENTFQQGGNEAIYVNAEFQPSNETAIYDNIIMNDTLK